MTTIIVPERRVAPIDLIGEVRAALEVAYAVIDAEFTNQPIGQEAASALRVSS